LTQFEIHTYAWISYHNKPNLQEKKKELE